MNNLKIKLITGFRKDQYYTIDAEESHKAYYLFLHPEERGVFLNGVAVVGSNIQGIEPDYHATMGWNATHELDNDDWTDIRQRGIDVKLRNTLSAGRELAKLARTDLYEIPLSEAMKMIVKDKPDELSEGTKVLAEKFKV